jgi:hypothetical protein
MIVYACNPSFLGGGDRIISSLKPVQAKVKETLISKTKYKQKGLGHGSSGRALA